MSYCNELKKLDLKSYVSNFDLVILLSCLSAYPET